MLVIGLLIAMISAVANTAIYQQRSALTQRIMQNTLLAIDQFATEDPLRSVYDSRDRATFGAYPPYQLANVSDPADSDTVAGALEPSYSMIASLGADLPNGLSERLYFDLGGGSSGGNIADYVNIRGPDADDDNRALSAYLTVFAPTSLRQIGSDALRPLNPSVHEYVNPTGAGFSVGGGQALADIGVVDVLGIHDGWGVPLDYFFYVKLAWAVQPSTGQAGWTVVDRRPVLRSRGMKRETYDTWKAVSATGDLQAAAVYNDKSRWLLTSELPKPWAPARVNGQLVFTAGIPQGSQGGWARAVANQETDYSYYPDLDP